MSLVKVGLKLVQSRERPCTSQGQHTDGPVQVNHLEHGKAGPTACLLCGSVNKGEMPSSTLVTFGRPKDNESGRIVLGSSLLQHLV